MCIDSLKYLYSISQTIPPSLIRDKAISTVISTTSSHFARPWSTQAPPFPPTYSASSEARETQGPLQRVCTCPRGGPDRGLLHAQLFRPQATNSFQHERDQMPQGPVSESEKQALPRMRFKPQMPWPTFTNSSRSFEMKAQGVQISCVYFELDIEILNLLGEC